MSDVFIPSCLDDADLSVAEFRVFCRVARCNGAGGCFQSQGTIAKGCRLEVKSVAKALAALVSRGLLVKQKHGRTDAYWVTGSRFAPKATTNLPRLAPSNLPQKAPSNLPRLAPTMVPSGKVPSLREGGSAGFTTSSSESSFERLTDEQWSEFADQHQLDGDHVSQFLAQHERDGWTTRNKVTGEPEPVRDVRAACLAFCCKLQADREGKPDAPANPDAFHKLMDTIEDAAKSATASAKKYKRERNVDDY